MEEFRLERYFDKYEFDSEYLLCSSDCESMQVRDLLGIAQEDYNKLLDISLGYTTSRGSDELRGEIANLYNGIGFRDVLTFAGAQEAIYVLSRVLLKKDDEVIVQFPCYQSLYQLAKEEGCHVRYWEMDPENNWELNLEFLKQQISDKTKCIVLNVPNNPTGYTITPEFFAEIVALARKHGTYILCDEVYRFIEYNKKDTLPGICELYEKGISIGVMSKSFGFPGLRIGWAVTKDPVLFEAMCKYKDYTSLCNNVLGEELSLIVLRNKESILQKNIDLLQRNLMALQEFLVRNQAYFSCVLPKAGSVAFLRLKANVSTLEFCKTAHERKNLFILPSEVFNYPSGFIRIGIGRKNFCEALQVLEEYTHEFFESVPGAERTSGELRWA